MSFIGKDGKRYYRFHDSKKNGTVHHGKQLRDAVQQQLIFRRTPIAAIVQRAINSIR